MDEDDYWNSSETKSQAFSFDDDVLSPQEILAIGQQPSSGQKDDSIFASTSVSSAKTLLPLNSLVSPKVLDLILLAQSGKDPAKEIKVDTEQTVAVTLKRLVLGRSCSLHVHRSLKSKTELLDGAIAIGDGNAILTVVLFLIQTLNKKLVYELLSSRPTALNHYISFLQNEGKITELTDLLTMLGRSPEAAMYQFQHYVKSQGSNVDGLLRKLSHLMANHLSQPGGDTQHAKMVADYVKLLEWQKFANKPELNNKSALFCLAYCCAQHWSDTAGNMMSPMTVCQRQQIPPLQYDWVVLNVHAKSEKWDIVETLFTKKDWLGRTTVSSHIPIETLLARLSELQASKRLMATCLNKITSGDDRLRLAQMYKVEPVVIETLAKQKDRIALTNYKMTLSPQSEVFILAENTLRDSLKRIPITPPPPPPAASADSASCASPARAPPPLPPSTPAPAPRAPETRAPACRQRDFAAVAATNSSSRTQQPTLVDRKATSQNVVAPGQDEDGFIEVRNKKRRRQRVSQNQHGTAPTGPNFLLRAAIPTTAVYLSRLHHTTTVQDVIEYIKKKANFCLRVQPLESRHNTNFKAFVVRIPTARLDLFMKEDFWPQGVVYRRFRGTLPCATDPTQKVSN